MNKNAPTLAAKSRVRRSKLRSLSPCSLPGVGAVGNPFGL